MDWRSVRRASTTTWTQRETPSPGFSSSVCVYADVCVHVCVCVCRCVCACVCVCVCVCVYVFMSICGVCAFMPCHAMLCYATVCSSVDRCVCCFTFPLNLTFSLHHCRPSKVVTACATSQRTNRQPNWLLSSATPIDEGLGMTFLSTCHYQIAGIDCTNSTG